VSQIVGLERRVAPGGKETITHPDRGHDDVANATAGAAKLSRYGGYSFFWPLGLDADGQPLEQQQEPQKREGVFTETRSLWGMPMVKD